MSDYLSGLAARAVGAARPARPRVPSLFEPAASDASDIRSLQAPARSESRPPAAQPEPAVDRRAPGPPPPRPRGRLRRPSTIAPPAGGSVARTAPRPARLPDAAPADPEPPARTPEETAPTPRAGAPRRPAKLEPASRADTPGQTGRRTRPAGGRVRQATTGGPEQPPPPSSPDAPRGGRRAGDAGAELRRPLPRVVRAPEAAARTGRREQAGASPTLVHVNIGRVDVRVPAPAAPASGARDRRKPPTALDDYLGRRNGTRR